MDIGNMICAFYLMPAVLLALYTTLRQVRAEHNGRPRPQISMVCFVPVLNLALLAMLAADRLLQLLEEFGDIRRKWKCENPKEDQI